MDFEDVFGDVDNPSAALTCNSYVCDLYETIPLKINHVSKFESSALGLYGSHRLSYILNCSILRAADPSAPGTSRHFSIIRKASKNVDESYGYFTHLPQDTNVVVNGLPFVNPGEILCPNDF